MIITPCKNFMKGWIQDYAWAVLREGQRPLSAESRKLRDAVITAEDRVERGLTEVYRALSEAERQSERWMRRAHECEDEMARLVVKLKAAQASDPPGRCTSIRNILLQDSERCVLSAGHEGPHFCPPYQWASLWAEPWFSVMVPDTSREHPQYAMYRSEFYVHGRPGMKYP